MGLRKKALWITLIALVLIACSIVFALFFAPRPDLDDGYSLGIDPSRVYIVSWVDLTGRGRIGSVRERSEVPQSRK